MHDPMVVVFDLTKHVTVWHHEPNGNDSGSVCKGMRGSNLSWHNARWAIRHRRHLSIQIHPYQRVQRWLMDHCSECGRKFRWKDSRHGYMSHEREVWHDECMTLRTLRGAVDDLHAYIDGTADDTQRWRVEYNQRGRNSWDANQGGSDA